MEKNIMEKQEVADVIACLGESRRVFRYYSGRYCIDSLQHTLKSQDTISISQLKQSALQRYLNTDVMVGLLSRCGSGYLSRESLLYYSAVTEIPFVVTLASWGDGQRGWDQTTRNHSNLVLQINFDNQHYNQYQHLVKPKKHNGPFEYWAHPIYRGNKKTLAWVRLDIDLQTNEVLIEEIQNDWLRRAASCTNRLKRQRQKKPELKPSEVIDDVDGCFDDIVHYTENVLKPYRSIWPALCMTAALYFIRQEIGIDKIFYHSFDTGKRLKAVPGSPPSSLYSQLPKQFGFSLSDEVPEMLMQNKFSRRCVRAINNPKWYRWQNPLAV